MLAAAPAGDGAGLALPAEGIEAADDLFLTQASGAERRRLERFIAGRFAAVYGADLYCFMPQLHGFYANGDELLAAFGLRNAGEESLFLERYLDQPVEAQIEQHAGVRPARSEIAEVGNLAGATAGALRQLIPLLTRLLHRQGYRWVVFTGAARLCNGFTRLGLPLSVMAPAPIERLPLQERGHWGSYYRHSPSVMLGDVLNGQRRLEALARSANGLDAALAPVARVGAP
ncbi:MAG TPA: thermostable hemolysin [Solimonas sp.]|nr:thermostable hemolysin [Solimonas sp.]